MNVKETVVGGRGAGFTVNKKRRVMTILLAVCSSSVAERRQ